MITFFTNIKKFHISFMWANVWSLQSLPMDIQLQILMNFDIKFDKGWDYELKDNILIINLHNVMISNNNAYEDQILNIFMHIYWIFLGDKILWNLLYHFYNDSQHNLLTISLLYKVGPNKLWKKTLDHQVRARWYEIVDMKLQITPNSVIKIIHNLRW